MPLSASAELAGASNGYTLRPMLDGWLTYPEKPSAYADADLVLVHAESEVLALVYVERGAATSLDDYVARRREKITERWRLLSVSESRRFLPQGEFVPVSVSFFRIVDGGNEGWYPLISAVARGPAEIVEVFVIGGTYPDDISKVEDLVHGLRFSKPMSGPQ